MSNRTEALAQAIRPTTIDRVKFRDGDLVDADALTTSMEYPASMLRTVLRSYLGCGVVCGLGLTPLDAGGNVTHRLCVSPGVLIDCHGYPVELCGSVELDLSPDPCADTTTEVCVVMRRIASDEVPADTCGRDTDDARYQCSRERDHAMIRVLERSQLESLTDSVCVRPEPSDQSDVATMCGCLTNCPPRCGPEPSWVLLGCVTIGRRDTETNAFLGIRSDDIDDDRRPYVKPIECLGAVASLEDRIKALEASTLS